MVLWWLAAIVGLVVVIPLVAVLAQRVVIGALEIDRYAGDILEHGVALSGNLDPVPALVETRDLVTATGAAASGYLTALERRVTGRVA